MIRINQLALEVGHGPAALKKKAARLLKIQETAIDKVIIVRQSIDARKKENLLYSYIAWAEQAVEEYTQENENI